MIEIMMASAVTLLIVAASLTLIKSGFQGLYRLFNHLSTEEGSRLVVSNVQRDFNEMNEILAISANSITFLMDSHRLPTYNPNAMVGGLPARYQVDQDGDAEALATSPAGLRFVGNDLDDDDDDGDGKMDVQCRYAWASGQLRRWFNYNETGWQEFPLEQNATLGISSFVITPMGTKAIDLYSTWDTDNDGLVTQNEIALRGGSSLLIDTAEELAAVASLRVDISIKSKGVTTDSTLQIMPQLLMVKRKAL